MIRDAAETRPLPSGGGPLALGGIFGSETWLPGGPLIWTNSRWERLRVGLIGLFVSGSDNVWARYVSPGDLGQAFGSCNTGK